MLGRVLFQSTECIVAAGLFGGYRVLDLQRNATHKLTGAEARFIDTIIRTAQRHGMPVGPSNPVLAEFFEEVAGVIVSHRSGYDALYNVFFFTTMTAEEFGRNLAEAFRESSKLR